MNILITGSSGFVGKQVINAFNEIFANVTLHLVLRPKKGNFNKKSKNIKSIIFLKIFLKNLLIGGQINVQILIFLLTLHGTLNQENI